MIGLLSQRTSPYEIAQQVISDAAYMCTRQHVRSVRYIAVNIFFNTFKLQRFSYREMHQ